MPDKEFHSTLNRAMVIDHCQKFGVGQRDFIDRAVVSAWSIVERGGMSPASHGFAEIDTRRRLVNWAVEEDARGGSIARGEATFRLVGTADELIASEPRAQGSGLRRCLLDGWRVRSVVPAPLETSGVLNGLRNAIAGVGPDVGRAVVTLAAPPTPRPQFKIRHHVVYMHEQSLLATGTAQFLASSWHQDLDVRPDNSEVLAIVPTPTRSGKLAGYLVLASYWPRFDGATVPDGYYSTLSCERLFALSVGPNVSRMQDAIDLGGPEYDLRRRGWVEVRRQVVGAENAQSAHYSVYQRWSLDGGDGTFTVWPYDRDTDVDPI